MAEPGSGSGSPSTSRPETPVREAPASPQSSLSSRASCFCQKDAGDDLRFASPPKVPDSVLPSRVAADSSSIATLDSMLDQEKLKHEVTPASLALEARAGLKQTAEPAKYSKLTKSSSDGEEIRWYFCKTSLRPSEAAAQVPASEVVGKGDYFRFSSKDSRTLESSFVQREEDLVKAWWKEYADVSAGPSISYNLQTEVAEEKLKSLSSDGRSGQRGGPGSASSEFDDDDDEESVGVLVKGGLYEVDLMRRRCIPVYWRGEHRRVLRGHWYARKGGLDWLPLREDVAEQLEIAYHEKIWRRRRFQPSGLYAARVDLTGTTMGLHALFTGEDADWEANLAVDASGISAMLGIQGSAVKLRRGFAGPDGATQDEARQKKEEDLDDYASQVPVRHVVFMVHGIGQRLEKANLVDDVGAFRQTVTALSEQHLTQHQRNAQRILFIPCQWRRELKLGGEVAMEQVTLDGVRALRTMITATVHDVLYYMSPIYCQDIIDSVTRSLNRLYARFIKRNPSFDGKVSLYGHSLGSVLTYDILCHQDTLKSAFPVQSINAAIIRNDEREDDVPKKDRLPSFMEHELTSEDDTSGQDMLSSASTVVDPAGTPTNETISEVEAAEKESAREAEDVFREPETMEGDAVLDEGGKKSLQSDIADEEGNVQKRTEFSEDDVPKEHVEVPDEDSGTQLEVEVLKETEVIQENIEVHEQDEVTQEDIAVHKKDEATQEEKEVSTKDDLAKELIEASKEDDVAEEHTETRKDNDITDVTEEDNVAKERTEVFEGVEGSPEHTKRDDCALEHVETSEGVEVNDAKNKVEDVGAEDNRTADGEILHDLESANSEHDTSDAAVTVHPQDAVQDTLQGLAPAESERALDLVDQVVIDSVKDYEEPSEIDRLEAEDAAQEEKLRLVENKDQGNATASENLPEIREEAFNRTTSITKENLPDSTASAENGRPQHRTGEDGQELGQSSRESAVGSMRGSLETSVSARKQHRPFIIYPKLKFKVETFYAVGSPLGMFLALRNIRIGLGTGTEYWQDEGIDEEMPACRLLLNIFHPYDPVAYRLEPLICKEYVDRKPVFIPYHRGGKRIHIGLQEFGEDISMKSKAFVNSIGAVGTRVAHVFTSKKDDSLAEEEERERNRKKSKTYGQLVMERLTGSEEGRIDWMLQDATFEHQYISAISSHTSYWQDPDTALFILKHLYRDIPEVPDTAKEPDPENILTKEPLHGTIKDGDEVVKAKPTPTDSHSSTVATSQDDWDSDDEPTSFWDKEGWVAPIA